MKHLCATWIGCVLLVGLAGSAAAHKVYFNGVEVEAGLAGQTFGGVEVRFDDQGNVWITAKGYAVRVGDGKRKVVSPTVTATPAVTMATPATPAKPAASATPVRPATTAGPMSVPGVTRHYYVVAMQSRVGATQYDVDVFLNGKWVKRVRAKDAHVVLDVTAQVKLGPNSVHFAAVKNYDGAKRFSTSPTDTMTVIVGEGTVAAGTCMIDTPLAKLDVSAADTQNQASDIAFSGR